MTTSVKTCFKCGEEKSLSAFYKHPQMGDGHLNKCKVCTRVDVKNHRNGPARERILAYDRERGDRRTKKQIRASNVVRSMILRGEVFRPDDCSECFSDGVIQAHHDDYDKPRDFRWLCRSCHMLWHGKNGPGANRHDP